jgi:hypothetical protein
MKKNDLHFKGFFLENRKLSLFNGCGRVAPDAIIKSRRSIFRFNTILVVCLLSLSPCFLRADPGIAWTSLPSSVVSGETYTPQAVGWEPDGNLYGVYMDISQDGGNSWSPFAYADGGDGNVSYNNGNSFTASPGSSYQFRIWSNSGDGQTDALYSQIYTVPTITWANLTASTSPQAIGQDPLGSLSNVNMDISKDGGNSWSPFAYAGGGDGYTSYNYGNPLTVGGRYQFRVTAISNYGQSETLYSQTYTVPYRFKILVDTNQLNATEATQVSILASDGVWAIDDRDSQWNPLNNPWVADWGSVYSTLNGASWTVSEDNVNSESVPYVFGHTEYFMNGRHVDAAMVYHEDTVNGTNTTLTKDEIDRWSAYTGRPIVVHARNFSSDPNDPVRQALGDPNCSGVVFELNATSALEGSPYNDGIDYCLSQGKKCYVILAPLQFSSGIEYLRGVQGAMSYFSQRPDLLTNPNLYFVVAAYWRGFLDPAQDDPTKATGVGFLVPDLGDGNNTVIAALNYLKAGRANGSL